MRRFILVGAAVAVVLVAVLVRTLTGASGPLHELSRAAPQRTFAPRLSISTPYRPCESRPAPAGGTVPRDECGPAGDPRIDLNPLAGGGESAAPDSLRAAALSALIWWDGKEQGPLDDAILRLDRARRLTLNPVPVLVDLSGAYLVRAQGTQNPRDLLEALEYALEALQHEPRNLPALWNAALATQAVGLADKAVEAWDAYLAVDRRSPWAHEAERRKRVLTAKPAKPTEPGIRASATEIQAFAREHPQEARVLGWGTALGGWGEAIEKGDSAQAALQLAFAETLGRVLKARTGGDASLADAVDAIHTVRGNSRDTRMLARAHRAYAVTEALVDSQRWEAARDSLVPVAPARTLSPILAQWADLSGARIAGSLGKIPAADASLVRLLAQVDSVRYPALAGVAQLTRGNVLVRGLGRYEPAREHFRIAMSHALRADEAELLGAAISSDGETAHLLADTVKAYELLHQAQWMLARHPRSIKLHNQLHGLARIVFLDGMPRSALAILDEDVRLAKRIGAPVIGIDVLQLRAPVRAMLGDSSGAEADLDSAGVLLNARPNEEALGKWARSVFRLARAGKASPTEVDSAVKYLAENNVTWWISALIRRADASLAADDFVAATADLEAVVARVSASSRRTDIPAMQRTAALEQARTRFDWLVMLYVRLGKPEEALRTLEQGRVSFAAVGDSGSASRTGPLRAPAGHVALEYALIGDTLLTWIVRAGAPIQLVRQQVDHDAFVLAVEQTGAALESRTREAGAHSGLKRLYSWLIRPVREHLGPPGTPLVILADGEIAGVPFEALQDSRDEYLLERHPIRHAPTLADASRPRPAGDARGPVLLVADPAFDRLRYPTLDPLGGARTEVDSLQHLFPGAVRLDSVYATREAFVERAQSASLIHYAGHAIFDDARPERSFLVLAGADTTGRLTAETVSGMRLGGVRLVVLSACRTLRSRGGRSGGFAGLSGALLSAGAGGVVGSLWQVSDGRAQPLMTAFHRAYRELKDPALALRAAQLEMLRSTDPEESSLATWAGFRYVGN